MNKENTRRKDQELEIQTNGDRQTDRKGGRNETGQVSKTFRKKGKKGQ